VASPGLLTRLWAGASSRVLVDGGTNVWYKLVQGGLGQLPLPDLVTGDLDSAEEASVEYFRSRGVEVVETPDQDHTDFTKALAEVGRRGEVGEAVVAYAELGPARLDHLFGNLQALALAPALPPTFLWSSTGVSWLLRPGNHRIASPTFSTSPTYSPSPPPSPTSSTSPTYSPSPPSLTSSTSPTYSPSPPSPLHCGLIPLSGAATVTTTGLRWNLTHQETRFGGLVSTSNSFGEEEEVRVETSGLLLWTMDMPGWC